MNMETMTLKGRVKSVFGQKERVSHDTVSVESAADHTGILNQGCL